MSYPLISVILPVYNAEGTLKPAIQSVLNQSFYNWELILVDNASTDDSRTIGQFFTAKDSRIRLLDEANQSVVTAFNTGLAQAQGQYIHLCFVAQN